MKTEKADKRRQKQTARTSKMTAPSPASIEVSLFLLMCPITSTQSLSSRFEAATAVTLLKAILSFSALLFRPSFFVDPFLLVLLIRHDLLLLEPQVNLLFRALDAVRAVADVATHIDGIVTTDGPGSRCERVGGSENH
jgi:hypothetical protein